MKKISQNRRVVVTGLGVVSSLGIGWQEFWKNLIAGKSGISLITAFDTSQYDRHMGGEVKNFDPTKFMSKRKAANYGRASQMAIAATKLAIEDANLDLKKLDRTRVGVCIGTTMGEPQVMEQIDMKFVKERRKLDYDIKSSLRYPSSNISQAVSSHFNIRGQNVVFATACASGSYSVARAFDLIKMDKCDVVVAGGSDALSRIAFTGFKRILAMAPEKCQPFDKNRKGMMMGEGAGILIVESYEHALKRKANIYAEIAGFGMSCDAFHMTEPSEKGVTKAIIKALKNAKIKADQVDHINAHGTGTKENDSIESIAINRVFGSRTKDIPVSAIKSMLGHTMGAASAFESISSCLSIKTSQIPPTINLETADSACNVSCFPQGSFAKDLRIVLKSSQAFGGNNVCTFFKL